MKVKRIIAAVVFICLLGGMMTSVGHFFRPEGKDSDTLNYLYKEDKDSLNVVMIGSSAIYRFWIPQQAYETHGFTSAIVGSAAQDIRAVPYLMDEVEKTQDVDLYVVEVRSAVAYQARIMDDEVDQARDTSWFSSIAMGMRPSLNRLALINDLLVEDEENKKLEWMIPILKYHGNAVTFTADQIVERLNGIKDTELYMKQTYRVVPMQETDHPGNDEIQLSEENKNSIDRIAAKAAELGKRVLFVSTPYFEKESRSYVQDCLAEYIRQQGYEYLDMSDRMDEIGLVAQTDYYDEEHTNISGAQKVTKYLSDFLAENYEMKDRLNEDQKAYWNVMCEEWNEEATQLMEKWNEEVLKGVTDEKE